MVPKLCTSVLTNAWTQQARNATSSVRSEIFIANRALQFSQLRQERHSKAWVDAAPDGAGNLNGMLCSINISLLAELADILCSISIGKIGLCLKSRQLTGFR